MNEPRLLRPGRYDSLGGALETHVRLAEYFARADSDDLLDAFARMFVQGISSHDPLPDELGPVEELQYGGYRRMLDALVEHAISQSDTYWLSSDVMDEVTELAEVIPDEPLLRDDLPSPAGFCVLPQPLRWRQDFALQAFAWVTTEQARVHLTSHGTSYDDGGVIFWGLIDGARSWDDFGRTGPPAPEAPVLAMGMWPVDLHMWAYDTPWQTVETLGDDADPAVLALPHTAAFRKWVLTLFRFCWQRLVRPEPWRPPRAEGRRAMRVLPLPEDGYMKVLHLRRVEYVGNPDRPQSEHPGYMLSYRYWRRAHWRTINKGTPDQRRVPVRAHWVGDESLPTREGFPITAVVR